MAHRNAPLTPEGRRRLCERVDAGRPICHVAAEAGVARQTLAKWHSRWCVSGEAGLVDRSSRPLRSPRCTDSAGRGRGGVPAAQHETRPGHAGRRAARVRRRPRAVDDPPDPGPPRHLSAAGPGRHRRAPAGAGGSLRAGRAGRSDPCGREEDSAGSRTAAAGGPTAAAATSTGPANAARDPGTCSCTPRSTTGPGSDDARVNLPRPAR